MSRMVRSLGLTDLDALRRQIDEVVNPARAIGARGLNSAQRYAEQLHELTSGANAARRALEEMQQQTQLLAALERDAVRIKWPNRLAELDSMSSLFAGNDVLNQLNEHARDLSKATRDIERLATGYSAFDQVLDHARELATGSSLQRMLESEASRFERAISPIPDLGVLGSAIPQLQEALNRERGQWDALLAQVAGPADLSFAHEARRLHEEFTQRAPDLSQFEPYFQNAIKLFKQFEVQSWSPATVHSMLNAMSWDDLLSAAEVHEPSSDSPRLISRGVRRKAERWRPTDEDLMLVVTTLGTLFAFISMLFEMGLIQRFDARETPPTRVPINHPRIERWAISTLPTMLFADPAEHAATLVRVPAGAWMRVLEHRGAWLLVEVESGERSRLQGWIRAVASRDLQEAVWDRGLKALGHAMGEVPPKDELNDVPDVVQRAGEDAALAYTAALASLKSKSTRSAYQRAFLRFFDFCTQADVGLTSVTAVHVIAYMTSVASKDSAATAKQHLIALRKLFEYMQAANVVVINPTSDIKSPRSLPRSAAHVSGEDVERLLQALAGPKEADVRDRAIVTLIAELGLKVSQLTALTLGSVEQDGDTRLHLRLGRRRERIAVPAAAHDALAAYVSLRRVNSPPDAPLFVSTRTDSNAEDGPRALARGEIYAMLQRRARACGIPELSCEGLRRRNLGHASGSRFPTRHRATG